MRRALNRPGVAADSLGVQRRWRIPGAAVVAFVLGTALGVASAPAAGATEPPLPDGPAYRAAIVGGADAPDGAYPFAVQLRVVVREDSTGTYLSLCGGALVAAQWVLTARHCVQGVSDDLLRRSTVLVGSQRRGQGTPMSVERATAPVPIGAPIEAANDVALLRLTAPAVGVPTVTLARAADGTLMVPGGNVRTIGWGSTSVMVDRSSGSTLPTTLQEGTLRVLDPALASSGGRAVLARGDGSVATCFGDSGSPLLAVGPDGAWRAVGVTSSGTSCDPSTQRAFFTATAPWESWLVATIGADLPPSAPSTTTPRATADGRPAPVVITPTGPRVVDGGVSAAVTVGAPRDAWLVAGAVTATGRGTWVADAQGRVYATGDAPTFGDLGALALNQPVRGFTPTVTGRGYWMVASDGGIFAFGDAGFFGSTGSIRLNQPITGMAPTPSGRGYWMVASDGGIFAFGDAGFFGSLGGRPLGSPVSGMIAAPDGNGYWLVQSDGTVTAFGSAG